MPARRPPAPARTSSPPQSGLRLHAEGDRHSALLKERDRLMSSIQTKKRALERAESKAHDEHSTMVEKLGPLVTRYEALRAELRALFDELLAPGRLSASAAKKVGNVRRTLVARGVWDEPDAAPAGAVEDDWEEHGRPSPPRPVPGDASSFEENFAKREVSSAEQRGQGKDRESLRLVFRRLVAASHPDRASNEAERHERTAVMKQATQAYEEGDLARLLVLERAWQGRQSLPPSGSAEARCRELELVIRELVSQAKELQSRVREAKRSSSAALATQVDEALEEARGELEELEAMRNFVLGFRDGKISLAQFVRGPSLVQIDDDVDLEALLFEILDERQREAKPPPARRKRQKR